MKTIKLSKRKAISPVIATVILVAVAITVAVGVSYWMSGIAGQYTSFEKVEIKSAYASRKYDATATTLFKGWVIEFGVQNTGSSPATLDSLFINDRPIKEYGITGTIDNIRWTNIKPTDTATWDDWIDVTSTVGVSLESGDQSTIYVMIDGEKTLNFGPDGVEGGGDDFYEGGLFSAGTTINVKIHSAGGMDYVKLVRLT